MDLERATVRVNGIVQSVGFRPFVYRRAVDHGLQGTVRNLGDAGARIELEGPTDAIDAFLADLRDDPPPLARVETVDVDRKRIASSTFETFEIVDSKGGEGEDGGGTVPPDTATCENCLSDIRDPDSRYHGYWATSCLDCGPRFTVIESLPYDRPTTSMAAFPLCDACRAEYENPADRRYHAQAMACPSCGPTLRYGTAVEDPSDSSSDPDLETGRDPFPDALEPSVDGHAAIERAAAEIERGGTVVLKGIGGAHLACDATDNDAVTTLRERTGRSEKPFALMVSNVERAAAIADLSDRERTALRSLRRPILLAETTDDACAVTVAPGLHTVGIMLPYSGVHHLLFDHVDGPLVMTSANLPGQPMLTANAPLVNELADVADGYLLHDRRIVARCDDSVARIVDGERRLVRRSRGFVPVPVAIEQAGSEPILGTGPELDVTAGMLHDGDCYLTQYVGDVDDLETLDYFETAIAHLLNVTGLDQPTVVAHDAHPGFNTTDYARQLVAGGTAERTIAVQHHHAHAASVLAEHEYGHDRAVALTIDGVGFGPDGTVWGGEVLDASLADYERVGGLAPVPMPGGDRATRHPARLAAGLLYAADPAAVIPTLERHDAVFPNGEEERDVVHQQLESGVNTPMTSSAGRFLDAVSALLGVCNERTYEGEPAMKLEAFASAGTPLDVAVPRTTAESRPVIDTPRLFGHLLDLRTSGRSRADVAATAQDALARGLASLAVDAADERGREAVALSGGVAYNDHIAAQVRERVSDAGLTVLGNQRVPSGDGGIAYGQVAVATARERDRKRG